MVLLDLKYDSFLQIGKSYPQSCKIEIVHWYESYE